jgi:hypothetical protein
MIMSRSNVSRMFVVVAMTALTAMAACGGGGGGKAKGGGSKGAGAESAHQKGGGNAQSDKTKGSSMGETYEGVTCDASTDGLAWCDTDTEIAFCSGGEWWLLDCASPEIGGDVCAEDGLTIDCYALDEL